MTRLHTIGWEWQHADEGNANLTAFLTGTFDTTVVRSGAASLKFTGTGGNPCNSNQWGAGVLSRNYYQRVYFRMSAVPSVAPYVVLGFGVSGSAGIRLILNSDATLQLSLNNSATGAKSAALVADTWYMVELRAKIVSGTSDEAEGRLEGVSFASVTGDAGTDTAPTVAQAGNNSGSAGPGAGVNVYFDDWALNDDQGSAQNTWPGPGKIILLKPVADSAVGSGWTQGTGTAISSNGWSAIDNTPPTAVADLTAGSDQKQIRNATSGTARNYDAQVTDYTAAGIPAANTISVVHPIAFTGSGTASATKVGVLGVVSNPAGTIAAWPNDSGKFIGSLTAGGFGSGWSTRWGAPVTAPSVTRGTKPVARIGQNTANTNIADVAGLGLYVEYAPVANTQSPTGTVTPAGALIATYVPGASGTTNPIAPTGTITPSGALALQVSKALAGTTTPAGAVQKAITKGTPLSGTLTPAGTLQKSIQRLLSGSLTPTGALAATRAYLRSFAGTITPTGAETRSTGKRMTGQVAPAASLVRSLARTLSGALGPVGALLKSIPRAFSGTVSPSGVETRSTGKRMTGTVTPSSTQTRSLARTLTGAITPAGTLSRKTSRTFTGTITPTATLAASKAFVRAFSGTITPASTLTRSLARRFTGITTPTATLTRRTSKTLTGTTTPTGAFTEVEALPRSFSGSIAPAGALNIVRLTGVYPISVGGTITPTGAEKRTTGKALASSTTPSGSVALVRLPHTVPLTVGGTLTLAGTETRQTAKKHVTAPRAPSVTPHGALTISVTRVGNLYVYDGAAWALRPAKVWSGTAWVEKPVKTWSGTAWE